MSPTRLFFLTKVRLGRHWLSAQLRQPGRTGLTLLVMAAVWWALYGIFRSGFAYTNLIPWLDTYLVGGLFGVFFLLVFLLLTLTSIVLTHHGLYHAAEAELLMYLPIAPERAALYRSMELGLYNTLGALFLVTPLLWAHAASETVPPLRLLAHVALLGPLLVIPHCVGTVITIALRRMAGRVPARLLAVGGAAIFLAAFFALLATFDFGVFDNQDHPVRLVNETTDALSGTRKWFLPSHWYVQAVFSAARGYPKMIWWFGGVLTTVAAACLLVWATVIRAWYYASWLAGGDAATPQTHAQRPAVNRLAQWTRALRPLPPVGRALLAKDALLFIREPVVRTQGLVMIGLLLVYFASLRSLYTSAAYQPMWMLLVSFVNFGALGVLLSAFACRFLLPLISLEGQKFWLLRTAPPRLSHIMLEKWGFTFAVLVCLGQPLLALSNYMTAMDRVFVITSHVALLCLAPAVAAIATGMGAVFPDLTGGGGQTGVAATLAFVVCLAFVAGFIVLLGLPYAEYILSGSSTYALLLRHLVRNIAGGAAAGLTVGMALLVLGHARLARAEIS